MGERSSNLNPSGSTGNEGQFSYYLARDGSAALAHLENPVDRLQRIPLLSLRRILSFGLTALTLFGGSIGVAWSRAKQIANHVVGAVRQPVCAGDALPVTRSHHACRAECDGTRAGAGTNLAFVTSSVSRDNSLWLALPTFTWKITILHWAG